MIAAERELILHCFCTYFDSGYLDRALVMIRSLARHSENMQLYVLPMDERCTEILKELSLPGVILLNLAGIETEEMKKLKAVRSRGEYCWIFTPVIVEYILDHFPVKSCTYIDADEKFYADPAVLLQENLSSADIGIVEHRFCPAAYYESSKRTMGTFCVEFNTFTNSEKSKAVLKDWKEKCMGDTALATGGDQKYLDAWQKDFPGVHVLQNHGGGVAPWNLARYRLAGEKGGGIQLFNRESKTEFPLVFFHFHKLRRLSENRFEMNLYNRPGKMDDLLVKKLYLPYLQELEREAAMLKEKYDLIMPCADAGVASVSTGVAQKALHFVQGNFWKKIEMLYSKTIPAGGAKKDIIETAQWGKEL